MLSPIAPKMMVRAIWKQKMQIETMLMARSILVSLRGGMPLFFPNFVSLPVYTARPYTKSVLRMVVVCWMSWAPVVCVCVCVCVCEHE